MPKKVIAKNNATINSDNSMPNIINKPASLKDLICSFRFDQSDMNQIKLLHKVPQYTRTFILSTFPRFLQFGQFLKALCNSGNINTSIFVSPVPKSMAQTNLTAIINDYENERTMAIKQNNAAKANSFMQKKLEAESLRDEIATDFNKLFEISIISTIFSNSQDNLNLFSEQLGYYMSKSTINLKSAWSQQEKAFSSNTPIGSNQINILNTFDTFSTAAIFPFLSTDINQPSGIPYAVHNRNGSPILIDTFYQALSNYNLIILGEPLTDKNTAAAILALRSAALDNVKHVVLDSSGMYKSITEFLGGKTIEFGTHPNFVINPFDIEPEEVKDDITGRRIIRINLEQKIKDVTAILMTMARGSIRSNYPNEIAAKIIYETVAEEYRSRGIDSNPDNLYSTSGANLIGSKISRTKKEMPTLGSWYDRLCKKAESNTSIEYKYFYEYLIKYMSYYIKDQNGRLSYYDGQTTLDFSNDTGFVCFDLSSLDNKFTKPLAQQIILSWINEKFIKLNSEDKYRAEKRRLVLEDASLLLPYPEAASTLNEIFSRSINRNISFTMVSDKFADFSSNAKLSEALANSSIKLLMRQPSSDLDKIKESFKLTEGETNFIGRCLKNEGILKIDSNSAEIYIAPNGYEYDLIESALEIAAAAKEQINSEDNNEEG